MRKVAFQLIDARVIKRRNFTVFFRAQARQPGFAGVNNEHFAFAVTGHGINELTEEFITVLIVNANTGFYRYRNRHHIPHGFYAVCHQLRIAHQACAKHAVLHPVRRTAHVKIDFIIPTRFSQLCALRQRCRIATAKLQRNRMFFLAIGQIIAFAVNNGSRGHHFGIQQRMA